MALLMRNNLFVNNLDLSNKWKPLGWHVTPRGYPPLE